MEPIAWPNAALARMFPEQNLLADQRHHDGVVHVVVGRITIGNILQREATNKTNDVRIGGLKDSVDLAVLASKLIDKRLDDNLCWVEHDRLQKGLRNLDGAAPRLVIGLRLVRGQSATAARAWSLLDDRHR